MRSVPFVSCLYGLLDDRPCRGLVVWLAYFASVFGLIFVVYAVGPTVTTSLSSDTMYHLNVGHRLWEGYRPYSDFHLGHGPLTFLLVALGISLAGVSMEAVWTAQMLVIALLGSLCFWGCFRRLSLFWTTLLTLTATSVLCMPAPLGSKLWREFGYAMMYNKISFVLFGIVAVSVLIPLREAKGRIRVIDSLVDGMVLALLAATKASFAVAALGLYVLAKVVWPQRDEDQRTECLWAAAAMCLVFFGIFAACRSSVGDYLEAVAVFKKMWDAPLILLVGRYLQFTNMIFYILVVLLLAYGIGFQKGGAILPLIRNAVLCTVAVGCFLVVTATCAQGYDVIPFLGVVPLSAILCVRRHLPTGDRDTFALSIAAFATILLFGTFVKDAALGTLCMLKSPPTLTEALPSARQVVLRESTEGHFEDERVSKCLRYIKDPEFNRDVVAALSLLKECGCSDNDVLYVCTTVDSVTMFSGCRYPRGAHGVYAWHMLLTPAVEAILPKLFADDFLADTKWILRYGGEDSIWKRLERTKGEYLATHFSQAGKRGHWRLYQRR